MLWRTLSFAGLAALLVALAAPDALGQKKEKKAGKSDAETAEPKDYAQLEKVKQVSGSVVAADPAGKSITLRVEVPHLEPNPKYNPAKNSQKNAQYQQQRNDLARREQQIMRERNPIRRQQEIADFMTRVQRLQNQQAKASQGDPNNQPYRVVKTRKDYELTLQEKVVFRKTFMSLDYDDMGNVKKYTKEQLDKLRGKDATKPGYASKLEEVVAGMEATLYLTPPKSAGKKKAAKDAEEGVGNVERPTVNMVVLTKDASSFAGAESPGERKKKN